MNQVSVVGKFLGMHLDDKKNIVEHGYFFLKETTMKYYVWQGMFGLIRDHCQEDTEIYLAGRLYNYKNELVVMVEHLKILRGAKKCSTK